MSAEYVPSYLLSEDRDDDRPLDLSVPQTISAPWRPFLPHQWELYRWAPKSRLGVAAILGGWGSGKSHGAMRRFIRACSLNPHTPAYGGTNPTAVMIAPTHRILKTALMRHWDMLVPREMVLKRRGPPYNDMLLANGVRVLLHSGAAQLEGIDACAIYISEIQHSIFTDNADLYLNYLARLRDPNSNHMMMIVDGLPESGMVRDLFDLTNKPHPDRITVMCSTAQNPHIPTETREQFLSACPGGQQAKLLGGGWMPVSGAVYPQYDASIHLTDEVGVPHAPVHLGVDIGNYGAAVIAQEIQVSVRNSEGRITTETGLLVVDQILTDNESVERLCYRLKSQTAWAFTTDSVIAVDPTIRRDELNALKEHFPQCRIVKRERGHEHFPIEAGVRITQRALLDALGNTRLFITRGLANHPRGLVEALQRYRRNERTGEAVKDQRTDHVADALRYVTCAILPPSKPESRYWKQ